MFNFGILIVAIGTKIELIALQTKTATLYLLILLCMLSSVIGYTQDLPNNNTKPIIPAVKDSTGTPQVIERPIDPLLINEQKPEIDTVRTDSLKINRRETLTDKVKYKAKDYERISRKLKKIPYLLRVEKIH